MARQTKPLFVKEIESAKPKEAATFSMMVMMV